MSSYRQILYHIIFRTYKSERTITREFKKELFAYITGYIKNRKCKLFRINGMEDHVHILSDLHPTIALSDYIKDLKTSSSVWMKDNRNFPIFNGWAEGYAALTYSSREKEMLINYIKNQEEHHSKVDFATEYRQILIDNNIQINEKFFLL